MLVFAPVQSTRRQVALPQYRLGFHGAVLLCEITDYKLCGRRPGPDCHECQRRIILMVEDDGGLLAG